MSDTITVYATSGTATIATLPTSSNTILYNQTTAQDVVFGNNQVVIPNTIQYYAPTTYQSSIPQYTIDGQLKGDNDMNNCGIIVNCTVPSYAWNGADFMLHCAGFAIAILAAAIAFKIYKEVTKTTTTRK